MKTFWKIFPFMTVIIMVVMGLVVECFHSKKSGGSGHYKVTEVTVSSDDNKTDVETIRLRNSLEMKMAEVRTLETTNKSLKAMYGDLLKASNVKAGEVKYITKVETVTAGRDTTVCFVDSFGGLNAHWKDNYANIDVKIDSARNAMIDYSVRDSITIISYMKKHSILFGLIKWKSHEGCKVITHNPKATPTVVVSYENIKR